MQNIMKAVQEFGHLLVILHLPCATQNEIDEIAAHMLINNDVKAVGEGANMPCTIEAIDLFMEHGLLFAPAKAANAGGVAVSAMEMSQNSMRLSWTFEEVDEKLQQLMRKSTQAV